MIKASFFLVKELTRNNISISKIDWDSFEVSWDFIRHPLVNFAVSIETALGYIESGEMTSKCHYNVEKTDSFLKINQTCKIENSKIQSAFEMWKEFTEKNFNQLKLNEEVS